MAAQDTSLLSQILSTQKALLSVFSSEKKKEKEEDKGKAKVVTQKGSGGFNEMLGELKTLNATSKKQLETLQSIDKKLVGGAGSSGSTINLKQNLGEKASALGTGMVDLAKGLVFLVGGLTFTLLLVPLAPALALATGIIYLALKAYTMMFEMLGSKDSKKNLKEGTDTLRGMGTSLAIFSLAIIASSLGFMAIGIAEVGMVAGTMLAFAGLFFLLGKGGDTIQKGAKAAAWMGIGMASIGLGVAALVLGLKYAGEVLAGSGGSALLGGLAALGILAVAGVTFAVLGLASPYVRAGAIAVAAIGLGLAVFGLGLTVYLSGIAKVMGVGGAGIVGGTQVTGGFFDTVGSMLVGMGIIAVGALSLVLYGTIFALAGQAEFGVPEAIVLGAIAMASIGLSLAFFGFGLNYYLGIIAKNSGVSGEGSGMTISAESFKAGFTTNASALGMLLGVGAIFALAGAVSPLIGLGAAAIAGAGLALVSLGYGINKFNELVPAGTKVGEDLKTNLVTIREAMLAFVDGENGEGGVLGALKGLGKSVFTGGKLAIALGNAILIGPALTSIAQGIGAWANIQNIPSIIGYDKMGQPIYDKNKTANVDQALTNIKTYLPQIFQPFIDVSNKANLSNTSLLSAVTGIDLGSSPFYRGITASAEIGAALTGIAQGIGSWANINNIPTIVGYDKLGQPIYDFSKPADVATAVGNIETWLPQIFQPFIDLSNSANLQGNSSLLSITTGIDLGNSPFYKGIKASVEIGAVLTSIGQGIGTWANIQKIPVVTGFDSKGQPIFDSGKTNDISVALSNITDVLTIDGKYSLLKPFIDLSEKAGLQSGKSLFSIITGADFGDTPFSQGISAASQIGGVLSSLAQGISVFHRLSAVPEVTGVDKKTGKPIYSGKTYDINSSMSGLKKLLESLIENMSGFDEDTFDSIREIGQDLMPLTTFMAKFLTVKPTDVSKGMDSMLKSIKGLGTINLSDPKKRTFLSMFRTEMEALSKIADPFTKFANSFKDMAGSMKIFADNFKLMNADGIKAFQLWTDSISTLSKTDPVTFASNVETANKAINTAYQSNDGNPATKNISDLFSPAGEDKKAAAIKDANRPAPKAAAAPAPAPMKIDYTALGQAIATALSTKQLNVYLAGENPNIPLRRK